MLCNKMDGPVLGSLLWQSSYGILQEQGVQIQFKLKISYLAFCAADSQNRREHFQISMKWE